MTEQYAKELSPHSLLIEMGKLEQRISKLKENTLEADVVHDYIDELWYQFKVLSDRVTKLEKEEK